MKTVFQIIWLALFTGSVLFQSCGKDPIIKAPPERLVQINDTLKRHEFEFKDLTWERQIIVTSNVIVYVADRDLFSFPFRAMEVSIRLDTSTTWQVVPDEYAGYGSGSNFLYGVDLGLLYVYPYPERPSLLGTKVSVRVKFI